VELEKALDIIAGQSIRESGTQLTKKSSTLLIIKITS